jgi:anhydro-N-acetylmuramic acid kinase
MNDNYIYSIGLMSGTSLDGLDILYVKFHKNNYCDFEIIHSNTIKYSEFWETRLKNSIHLELELLSVLDYDYGLYLGNKTQDFISKNKITSLDFIASHGHTVLHQPDNGITFQVGDGQQIYNITNCTTVSDFRTQDVELGGQGAPLVPIGDRILFSEYEACVNLGGFANISYEHKGSRIAFDICPVNIVMNHYCKKYGLDFDDKGNIASTGVVYEKLLEELNTLAYYSETPPKSLGLEWVNQYVFPLFDKYNLDLKDMLRTFLEHVAQQISIIIHPFNNVLFTGGGVYNDFLIERIENLSTTQIIIPKDDIINYKEALIFSLLGLLKLEDKINCLSSVTGAKINHSSGKIFNQNISD